MQKKKKPRSMLKEMALTLLGLTLGLFVLLLILGWEYPATLHALDRGKTEGCTSTVLRLEENYRPLGRWYSDRHYFDILCLQNGLRLGVYRNFLEDADITPEMLDTLVGKRVEAVYVVPQTLPHDVHVLISLRVDGEQWLSPEFIPSIYLNVIRMMGRYMLIANSILWGIYLFAVMLGTIVRVRKWAKRRGIERRKQEKRRKHIILNQFAQNIYTRPEMERWFAAQKEKEKRDTISVLCRILMQVHPTAAELGQGLAAAGQQTTAAGILQRSGTLTQEAGNALRKLPEGELGSAFLILLLTFQIADERCRAACGSSCKHWWHMALPKERYL